MGIQKYIDENLFNFFLASIPLTLVFLISSYILITHKREQIRDDWPNMKCKPFVMPFASLFKKFPEGPITGTANHFFICIAEILKPIFEIFLAPVKALMSIVYDTLMSFVTSLDSIRKFMTKLRGITTISFVQIFDGLEGIATDIRMTYLKIVEVMRKMDGLNRMVVYMMQAIAYTVITMFGTIGKVIKAFIIVCIALGWFILWCCIPYGPVISAIWLTGWAAGIGITWSCFDENTLVTLSDGKKRPIPFIRIGDKVMFGGKVTGIFKFSSENANMYRYNDIIVEGSHNVYDNNEWKSVEECDSAIKIEKYNKEFIYCLSTENNRIFINDTMFTDYYEISDTHFVSTIRNEQLRLLNNITLNSNNLDECHYFDECNYFDACNALENFENSKNSTDISDKSMSDNFGFNYTCQIPMKDGSSKPAHKIKINDETTFGTIKATIKLERKPTTKLYKNRYFPELIVSDSQWMMENKKWVCVSDSRDFELVNDITNYNFIYNFLTDSGTIKIDRYTFTDYNEMIHTQGTLGDDIDKLTLEYINSNMGKFN